MCLRQCLPALTSRKPFGTGRRVPASVACPSRTCLVVQLDVHPAPVRVPQLDRAHAADGEALQHREGAAARLTLRLATGPLPPLVVLLEQVEGLPGCQDGQRSPGIVWEDIARVSRS